MSFLLLCSILKNRSTNYDLNDGMTLDRLLWLVAALTCILTSHPLPLHPSKLSVKLPDELVTCIPDSRCAVNSCC
jgi:hypothetical protein